MPPTPAEKRAEMPAGTNSVLNRRTLARDFRVLDALLKPGLTVLDVGCGSGVLTIDMAMKTAPSQVLGADINDGLLAEARTIASQRGVANVGFVQDDVCQSRITGTFDIVASARMLQWLEHPQRALETMLLRVKKGGRLILLDYNYEKIVWEPRPPATFLKFWNAFLDWRSSSGMHNSIGDELAGILRQLGLQDVMEIPQPEIAERGMSDFENQLWIWRGVADSRGRQVVADGYLSEEERAEASADYLTWMKNDASRQVLYLVGVVGQA